MATEIVWAAGDGDLERIKIMVKNEGVDVNVKANRGWSAILMAVYHGHLNVAKYLIEECNVNINDSTAEGNGPLHLCCQQSRPEIFMYLVEECKADIFASNNLGNNPLHLAALYGQIDAVKHLIENRQMDQGICNVNGATALHCAFAGGQIGILRYLMIQAASLQGIKSPEKVNYHIAKKFIQAAERKNSNVSLQNVVLVSIKEFLKFGSIPKYEQCEKLGIHFYGGTCLNEKSSVLFISHRWQSDEEPDPDSHTFSAIEKYISQSPIQFDFIWIDYSCIVQNKQDTNYSLQIENIPTAIFAATHFLAIPSKQGSCTHIADYLNRGWVQMETMLAMFSGCQMIVVFGRENDMEFVDVVPHGSNKHSGFRLACEQALKKMGQFSNSDLDEAWGQQGTLLKEPVELLKKYVDAVIVCKNDHPEIFEHMCMQTFTVDDINFLGNRDDAFLGEKVYEAYNGLGEFSIPTDRIEVAKLVVFSIAYSMYDMGVVKDSIQSPTSTEDLHIESIQPEVEREEAAGSFQKKLASPNFADEEKDQNKNTKNGRQNNDPPMLTGDGGAGQSYVGGSMRSELAPDPEQQPVKTGCKCVLM